MNEWTSCAFDSLAACDLTIFNYFTKSVLYLGCGNFYRETADYTCKYSARQRSIEKPFLIDALLYNFRFIIASDERIRVYTCANNMGKFQIDFDVVQKYN